MSKGSLREDVRHGIGRIIGLQLLFTMILVVGAAFGLGYYIIKSDLETKQRIIGARLSAEISTISSSLEALASSPVLWTALTDTTDRNAYLTPLLQSLNRTETYRVGVLDYRGREFVMPPDFFLDRSIYSPTVQPWLDSAQLHFEVIDKPDAGVHVLIVVPIVSPMSQSIVGYVSGVYSVNRSLKQLDVGDRGQISVSFKNPGSSPMAIDKLELISTSQETIKTPTGDSFFYLTVSESYQKALWSFVLIVCLLALIGLYARQLGARWADAFSRRTLGRLESLLTLSRGIIRGERLAVPAQTVSDEIGEVENTLRKLLTDQATSLDRLKTAASVFMTAGEAILVTDRNGVIIDVNPALLGMTGFERHELIGSQAGKLYRSPERMLGDDQIAAALAKEGTWRGETSFFDRDGEIIPAQLAVSRVFDSEGAEQGQVAVFTDIREIKRAEETLRELAYEDSLTGLPNYRAFAEIIQRRIELSGGNVRFLLAFIDLDRLKQINDLYGHEKGDEIIQAAAQHFTKALPAGHVLCRRSGDEFLALVEFTDDAHLQRLRDSLNQKLGHYLVTLEHSTVRNSASVGITEYPRYASSFRTLLQQADAALFEAKRGDGGSKVAWYSQALGYRLARSLAVESSLPSAIRSGRIVPFLQPEVEMPSGKIIGFEALARWSDPELGVVTPDEFIPIAEEINVIGQLTESILAQVMLALPGLQARFPGVTVAVNISPKLFANRRIVEMLTNALDADDQQLDHLVLEITESDLSSQLNLLMSQLQLIRGLGVRVAIDDFGKGYSSLSRLANMPLDKLKIDSSFVAGIGNSVQENIVNIILALANSLHLSVTAEGVETSEQVAALVAAGCTRAQGWYYSKALPIDQALLLPDSIKPSVSS